MADIRVDWRALQGFTTEVFTRAGLPPQDAAIEAEVLVWANLRGVDSHGVLRVPQYLRAVDAGIMNPRPNIRVEKETVATALVEGGDEAVSGPYLLELVLVHLLRHPHLGRADGLHLGRRPATPPNPPGRLQAGADR